LPKLEAIFLVKIDLEIEAFVLFKKEKKEKKGDLEGKIAKLLI